jgi:hypothetical protein
MRTAPASVAAKMATDLSDKVIVVLIAEVRSAAREKLRKSGSPGRIRTSDQPVNSRLLYH